MLQKIVRNNDKSQLIGKSVFLDWELNLRAKNPDYSTTRDVLGFDLERRIIIMKVKKKKRRGSEHN